jgi:hypothetical protein
MKTRHPQACAIFWSMAATGCAVRNPALYREDVRKILETKHAVIQACYEAELQTKPKANGRVTVRFLVQRQQGIFVDPKIDDLASTPDRTLRGCVLEALDGLVLHPPDDRAGDATFTWDFQVTGR